MSTETLIRCCAPTMARLKTGNMFACFFENREQMIRELRQLNRKLGGKGLRILPLRWHEEEKKALLYLYRPSMLEKDLNSETSRRLLMECGYEPGSINQCLTQLMSRIRGQDVFPHEVGLFLGYPPADVDGFMHRKDQVKLCGMWKVYDDVDGAMRQFRRCKHCTRVYLQCYARGTALEKLAVAG